MAVGDRVDPYAQFNFLIEIGGQLAGGFTEVSGLNSESDVIEYREGSDVATNRKLPGLRKFGNITLKRGYTDNMLLWNWRKTTLDGHTQRQGGAIVLLDEAGQSVLRYEFSEGWIAKYEGAGLNAKTNEVAIETVEIVHEGLELKLV